MECGVITFDLLRQMSVWCDRSYGDEDVAGVTRLLFYGEDLTRLAATGKTSQLVHNYREIFLPWLIRVLERQSVRE
jgi:hypothetical protein